MSYSRTVPYNSLPLLPPSVELESKQILKKAIKANMVLAGLKSLAQRMPNQGMLIDSIILQEAKLSSEIENIVTTSDDLYRAAADGMSASDPRTKEVLRYREALWHGFKELEKRPICTNLFIEVVSRIRKVDMEIRKVPGTALKNSLGEVVYTPPEGEAVIREKLSNLETFIHADDDVDPLIKLAVIHYQFEAIHPFGDGNGRTGRILNILYLVENGLLDIPVLFLSHYILQKKAEYYNLLRQVTEHANWEEWILFMLTAVEVTAKQTHDRVIAIMNLMDEIGARLKVDAPKIYTKDLVEVIHKHPYCKIKFLEEESIAKRQTASEYLRQLGEMGILRPYKIGREMYYINHKLIDILSKEWSAAST